MGYRHIENLTADWPHGVGCELCAKHELCNECGEPLSAASTYKTPEHCTNGRCMKCHATVCGEGDAHAPYRHSHYVRTADELKAGMSLAEKVRQVEGSIGALNERFIALGKAAGVTAAKYAEQLKTMPEAQRRMMLQGEWDRAAPEAVKIPAGAHPYRRCVEHNYDYVDTCEQCRVYKRLNESDLRILDQDIMRLRSHKHGG